MASSPPPPEPRPDPQETRVEGSAEQTRAVDGLIMPSAAMREVCGRLSTMSAADRSELPCIGDDRASLVVAGCAILESILDIWPAEMLRVADRGIREGILRSLIAADAKAEESRAQVMRRRGI